MSSVATTLYQKLQVLSVSNRHLVSLALNVQLQVTSLQKGCMDIFYVWHGRYCQVSYWRLNWLFAYFFRNLLIFRKSGLYCNLNCTYCVLRAGQTYPIYWLMHACSSKLYTHYSPTCLSETKIRKATRCTSHITQAVQFTCFPVLTITNLY